MGGEAHGTDGGHPYTSMRTASPCRRATGASKRAPASNFGRRGVRTRPLSVVGRLETSWTFESPWKRHRVARAQWKGGTIVGYDEPPTTTQHNDNNANNDGEERGDGGY